MSQEGAQSDCLRVLSFDRFAIVVEAVDDVEVFEFWDVRVDRFIEREFALLDKLQSTDGGHEFCTRGDPHGVASLQWFGVFRIHRVVAEGLGVFE